MAIYLAENPNRGLIRNPEPKLFEGNQQDVDVLIAFEHRESTRLILICQQ